jgi:hypothetical protein
MSWTPAVRREGFLADLANLVRFRPIYREQRAAELSETSARDEERFRVQFLEHASEERVLAKAESAGFKFEARESVRDLINALPHGWTYVEMAAEELRPHLEEAGGVLMRDNAEGEPTYLVLEPERGHALTTSRAALNDDELLELVRGWAHLSGRSEGSVLTELERRRVLTADEVTRFSERLHSTAGP